MEEPTLVILAAGLSSKYGGLKQIDPVGNNGESLIDFSLYDAYQAGFRKVVLIIRKEHEELFEEAIGINIRPFVELNYAYQSTKILPEGFSCPRERTKPWGTAHALLTTRSLVDGPFTIINSDDYYGKETFVIMYDFLRNKVQDDSFGMIGYQLTKTLTDNGPVKRGICKEKNGLLIQISETSNIIKKNGKPYILGTENAAGTKIRDGLASMNYFGFTPAIYPLIEKQFNSFLNESINIPDSELILSTALNNIIKENHVKVNVLKTDCEWFGVTYPLDKENVKEKLAQYKEDEIYPFDLWD